jgi:hypothetical protein
MVVLPGAFGDVNARRQFSKANIDAVPSDLPILRSPGPLTGLSVCHGTSVERVHRSGLLYEEVLTL